MEHSWYGASYLFSEPNRLIKCLCLNCDQAVYTRPAADFAAAVASVVAYDPELVPCAEAVLLSVHAS